MHDKQEYPIAVITDCNTDLKPSEFYNRKGSFSADDIRTTATSLNNHDSAEQNGSQKETAGTFQMDNGRETRPETSHEDSKLAKGVLLNPSQFVRHRESQRSNELKNVSKDQEADQNHVANNTSISMGKKVVESIVKNKGMSIARKITFCLSFIPVLMFVLFFVVILPCEETGIKNVCDKNATNTTF